MIHNISRYLLTLVALFAMTTGAWADETPIVTITATGSGPAYSVEGIVTLETGGAGYGAGYGWVSGPANNLTVTAADGVTITKVKFFGNQGGSWEDTESPFQVLLQGFYVKNASGTKIGSDDGVISIEVYGTIAPAGPKVTTNAAEEGATFTEASFEMPTSDVDVNYELVRDMSYQVIPVIADRIRIKKDGTTYVPVTATELMPVIIDKLDEQNPVTMVLFNATNNTGDYTVKLQKKVEGDTPSWADAEVLSVGTFRYVITGTNLYDGEITTNEFTLFEGFEVTVPAGEYATFYKDENLYVEDSEAQLYTITSVGTETATATELTVAKANMPILVKNNGQEKKVILLIPTVDDADEVTAAKEFVGTLVATIIPASTSEVNSYAFNGKQFVWVKNAIEVGANRAWLHILTGAQSAPVLNLVFEGEVTGISEMVNGKSVNGQWYDLNGRKLQNVPTKKGIYILNGKKVVVK